MLLSMKNELPRIYGGVVTSVPYIAEGQGFVNMTSENATNHVPSTPQVDKAIRVYIDGLNEIRPFYGRDELTAEEIAEIEANARHAVSAHESAHENAGEKDQAYLRAKLGNDKVSEQALSDLEAEAKSANGEVEVTNQGLLKPLRQNHYFSTDTSEKWSRRKKR